MSLYEKIEKILSKISLPGSLLIEIDDKKISLDHSGNVGLQIDNPDCTLQVSSDTLQSILDGSTAPMTAYFSGDLKITGDMGIAMALSKYLKN